jgi:hypothetical protein
MRESTPTRSPTPSYICSNLQPCAFTSAVRLQSGQRIPHPWAQMPHTQTTKTCNPQAPVCSSKTQRRRCNERRHNTMKRDALRPTCTLAISVLYTSVPMHQCRFLKLSRSLRLADYLPTHHIRLCLSASSLREQPSIADYSRTFSSTQQCRFLTTHSQPSSILNKTLVPLSTNQAVVCLSLCVSLRATEHSTFSQKLFQAPPSSPDSWQPNLNKLATLPKTLVPQSPNQAVVSLYLCLSLRATEHSTFSQKLFQAPSRTDSWQLILNQLAFSTKPLFRITKTLHPRPPPSKSLCRCLSPLCTSLYVLSTPSRSLFFYVTERALQRVYRAKRHPHHQDINPTTIQICVCMCVYVCVCVSLSLYVSGSLYNEHFFVFLYHSKAVIKSF